MLPTAVEVASKALLIGHWLSAMFPDPPSNVCALTCHSKTVTKNANKFKVIFFMNNNLS